MTHGGWRNPRSQLIGTRIEMKGVLLHLPRILYGWVLETLLETLLCVAGWVGQKRQILALGNYAMLCQSPELLAHCFHTYTIVMPASHAAASLTNDPCREPFRSDGKIWQDASLETFIRFHIHNPNTSATSHRTPSSPGAVIYLENTNFFQAQLSLDICLNTAQGRIKRGAQGALAPGPPSSKGPPADWEKQ